MASLLLFRDPGLASLRPACVPSCFCPVLLCWGRVEPGTVFVLNRKLSAEELERKRQEMMENAKWREEGRLTVSGI